MKRVFTVGSLAILLTSPRAFAENAPPRVLHLNDAVQIALAHQPSVFQARGLTAAASGRVEEARSGYLPQVTGTALAERVHGRPTTAAAPTTVSGTTATYDIFGVGVSATQLIYDFGQTIDRTRAASAAEESLKASERTTAVQVALQVRKAFFQAHAEKALVKVGQDTVANQERHLVQIQGFVDQGIRPEIDLAQAKTDLANSRVTLINARTGYATARAQLNQAMGVFGPTTYEVGEDDLGGVAGEDEDAVQLLPQALAARPEIMTLRKQQRADELTVSSIKGGYGPTIAAVGGVSEAGATLDALGTNWNVGATLTWPFFQGGLTQGQVREAEGNLESASAQISQEELAVRVELEQALLAVQAAKVVIDAARDAVTNAHEQLRLAEGRYQSGVGSIIELDDAQLADAAAGAQMVQAEYTLASARADLLSALGK